MENRKKQQGRFSPLPVDYLKMVKEVFTTNFDSGLRRLAELSPARPYFDASGRIYGDEIVLCVSLMSEGQLAATSVYASCDFDPKASAPTIQDLLSVCVDAVGAIFSHLFAPGNEVGMKQLAEQTLSAFENIPFEWTLLQMERHKVFVKVDKANPSLDEMADHWLKTHDPDLLEEEEQEQAETEKLFITGDKAKGKPPTSH